MKFEIIKKDNKKKYIIASIVVIAIIVTITYISTRAKYKITSSVQLARGTINYSPTDFEIVSIKIQNSDGSYQEVETVPTTGYELNTTKTVCKVKEANQDVTMTYTNGKLSINGITTKGTKCEIYFDKKIVGKELILSHNTIDTSRSSGKFTSGFGTNTAGKIFSAEDDDGTTYFFAGASPNNWVSFAGFYWRIIRVNGDGSIRLIYNGTSTSETGSTTQIGTSKFSTIRNDNAYVGYMYGTPGSDSYEDTHANINSSTIKTYIDTWYEENLKTNYEKYIDLNAGFCGDRSLSTGTGVGKTPTAYAPYKRLNNMGYNTYTATYKCAQINDLYTWKNKSKKGNKALINPIGLITSDEVIYAGGTSSASTSRLHWLVTRNEYWTMSPADGDDTYGEPFLYSVANSVSGYVSSRHVSFEIGMRPVINLKSDALKLGSGTTTDPYRVS